MASLSERLKRERELRGVSLRQISEDTKITVRFLEALEGGRLDLIPGEFYRRSYLRAYARYLGLDEERALNAYALSRHEKAKSAGSASSARPSVADADALGPDDDAALPKWMKGAMVLFLLLVAIGVLYFLGESGPSAASPPSSRSGLVVPPGGGASVPEHPSTSGGRRPPTPFATPNPASSPPTASEDSSPGAAVGSDGEASASPRTGPDAARSPSAPAGAPPEGLTEGSAAMLRLVLSVDEACWLEIHADGRLVATGLKEQGYRQAVSARREVRLWLGNAGGVSLWLNDRPVRPLGRPGQVRKDLSITPDNYRSYLSTEEGEGL